MQTYETAILFLLEFFVSFAFFKLYLVFANKNNITANDVHKKNKKVAFSGGIVVFIIWFLFYFIFSFFGKIKLSFSMMFVFLIFAVSGFILGLFDDFRKEKGSSKFAKVLFFFLVLSVVYVFFSRLFFDKFSGFLSILPFSGNSVVFFFYLALLFVFSSNALNVVGGYNGLDTSVSAIVILAIIVKSLELGNYSVFYIAVIFLIAILTSMRFTLFPARLFLSNSFSLMAGPIVFMCFFLMGDFLFFLIVMIPFFFEFFIMLFQRFRYDNFSDVDGIGNLSVSKKKIYSIEQIIVFCFEKFGRKAKEYDVVIVMSVIVAIFSFLALLF